MCLRGKWRREGCQCPKHRVSTKDQCVFGDRPGSRQRQSHRPGLVNAPRYRPRYTFFSIRRLRQRLGLRRQRRGLSLPYQDVFCTTGACGTAQPAIDLTWGTAGAVHVCTGQLTAPVLNFFNLNIYVGCSDGKLYAISQAGTVASLAVGDGVTAKNLRWHR